MRIALDLDGSAFKHIEFFSEFSNAMKERGHEIGVLTARIGLREDDLKALDNLGFPPIDFYISRTQEDHLIGAWKAKMLEDFDIDILFDDFGGSNSEIERTFYNLVDDSKLVFQVFPGE